MYFMPLYATVCGSKDAEARGIHIISATVVIIYIFLRQGLSLNLELIIQLDKLSNSLLESSCLPHDWNYSLGPPLYSRA